MYSKSLNGNIDKTFRLHVIKKRTSINPNVEPEKKETLTHNTTEKKKNETKSRSRY